MKSRELMVGDWVIANGNTDNKPHRVTALTLTRIDFDNNEVHVAEYIEPIPLTAEILEKNGFEVISRSIDSTSYRLGLREVFVFLKEGYFNITIKDTDIFGLTYVHELQHAMRLCGLTELADNFEV